MVNIRDDRLEKLRVSVQGAMAKRLVRSWLWLLTHKSTRPLAFPYLFLGLVSVTLFNPTNSKRLDQLKIPYGVGFGLLPIKGTLRDLFSMAKRLSNSTCSELKTRELWTA